jgi:hypothetical protein
MPPDRDKCNAAVRGNACMLQHLREKIQKPCAVASQLRPEKEIALDTSCDFTFSQHNHPSYSTQACRISCIKTETILNYPGRGGC